MSTIFTCHNGHRWNCDPRAAADSSGFCPVCGSTHVLTDAPSASSGGSEGTVAVTVPVVPAASGTSIAATERKNDAGLPSIPGYEIMAVLGRGGMGVVYKARQIELKRVVALKMVLAGEHAGPQDVARFRTEAEAVASLQHPNIVQIHEIGEWRPGGAGPPLPYFSLEFVEGGSLDKLLAGVPQPPRQAAAFMEIIARAMHHAHQHGVVHRDLKPANILLVSGGVVSGEWCERATAPPATTHHSPLTTHQPKITDFGLAKQMDSEHGQTGSGAVLGTPSYMAPEQAAGLRREIGPATDVYALGALLYELLTGRPPFRGETAVDTMLQVMTDEPVPPSRLQPKVPRDLETICLKCLQKEARKRYASAEELADDLRRFAGNEPILARPVSLGQRAWKWARRKPAAAALVAVTGLAAVSLAVLAAGFTVRLDAERRTAEHERDVAQRERDAARERLVQMHVASGTRLLDDGDWAGSLIWFGEAMRLDNQEPERSELHRLRLGSVLRQGPRLLQMCWHGDAVAGVEVSPDGRRVLTASRDGSARLWDPHTGQLLTPPLKHGANVFQAAFSPDGRYVATSGEMTVRLWDSASGKELAAIPQPISLARMAFSPDSSRLALARGDGTAGVWEVPSGKALLALPKQKGTVSWVEFSPDGRRLATARSHIEQGDDAVVWDAATGRQLTPPMPHLSIVHQASFSPDGTRLVTASSDRTARIWNSRTGQPLLQAFRHPNQIQRAVFSPDGRQLATAGLDHEVHVWDSATGGALLAPLRHEGSVAHVAFSSDGRWLVTASTDRTARVWSMQTGKATAAWLLHGGWVYQAAFGPDARWVVTASDDGTARVWDAVGGPLHADAPLSGTVTDAAFSADGSRALLWRASPEAFVKSVPPVNAEPVKLSHPPLIRAAALSPDGRRVVTAGEDLSARLWDVATGQALGQPLPHSDNVGAVSFLPDGRRLLTCARPLVQLWEPDRGALPLSSWKHPFLVDQAVLSAEARLLVAAEGYSERCAIWVWELKASAPARRLEHPSSLSRLALAPSGERLATAGPDGVIRLWEPAAGREIATFKHADGVSHLAFSADGLRLLTASMDNTARVWDAIKGQPITPPLRHEHIVEHAAFRADGCCVVTASFDHTARVWDAATGAPLTPPLPHGERLIHAGFDPSGCRVITVTTDGTLRVWDVTPDPRPLEDLLRHAELLAGARIDQGHNIVVLDRKALQAAWDTLRSRYPAEFAQRRPVGDSRAEALVWHQRQALDCAQLKHWYAAVWHLDRVLPVRPDDWVWHARRGIAHAELGDWDRASHDHVRALELGCPDPLTWISHALLRLQAGDVAGYRQTCDRLLKRCQDKEPDLAFPVVWCCTTGPEAVADPAALVPLMQTALAKQPKNTLYLGTLGAARLRAGDIEAAIPQLREAVRLHPTGGSPPDLLLLALAHHRLGQGADAQKYLQQAVVRLDQIAKDRARETPGGPTFAWNHWLRMLLLRGEVENALKSPQR